MVALIGDLSDGTWEGHRQSAPRVDVARDDSGDRLGCAAAEVPGEKHTRGAVDPVGDDKRSTCRQQHHERRPRIGDRMDQALLITRKRM